MDPQLPPDCAQRFGDAKVIWAGSASATFSARDRWSRQPAIVKVLTGPEAIALRDRGAFLGTAEQLRTVEHPGLATIVAFGAQDGAPWIAFEALGGPSVREALKARPFDWRNAFEIAAVAAEALAVAHKAGVLHGDVRPEKIVASRDGAYKLVDCGLADFLRETLVSTARGTLFTTATTLAPERIRGDPATPATDIYALGATLYEMVTGRPLFVDESGTSLLDHHLRTPPPAPSRDNPDLPAVVDQAVLKALSKAPGDRFPSAATMARTIREAVAMAKGDTVPRMRPRKGSGATKEPGSASSGGSLAPGAHLSAPAHGRWILLGIVAGSAISVALVYRLATDRGPSARPARPAPTVPASTGSSPVHR